ncbi:hypothetical protein KDI_20730 [Dictyobacter arantiisoli]|uniref:Pyrrolo-quinoline quinone repeat domain-containing protein n=2 Tax=Dictyobacter arantiisoli TaxID=2014874 RepID=A0A5A5TBX2_9CHLR|nr:hypothetical protein KDI_20730 [Dictyobacter arantiisoli]
MGRAPLAAIVKKRFILVGMSFCLITTLFLVCTSASAIGVNLLSGFTPAAAPHFYLHGVDDAVYTVNAATGAVEGHYNFNYRDPTLGTLSPNPGYVKQDPVLVDHEVVYYDGYRGIYAAHLRDGTPLWKHNLSAVSFGDNRPLQVSGNVLYVFTASSDMLSALHTSDGALLWHHTAAEGIQGAPADFHTRIFNIAIVNNVLYYTLSYTLKADTISIFFALNARSGALLWNKTISGSLVITSDKGAIYIAGDATLYAYRLQDGHLLWQRKGLAQIVSVTTVSGLILVCDTEDVFALHENDHSFAWIVPRKNAIPGENVFSIFHGIAYIDSSAIDISSGRQLWQFPAANLVVDDIDQFDGSSHLFNTKQNFIYITRAISLPESNSSGLSLEAVDYSTGGTAWWQDISSTSVTDEVFINGTLLMHYQNKIYAYMANTGQFLWEKQYKTIGSLAASNSYFYLFGNDNTYA